MGISVSGVTMWRCLNEPIFYYRPVLFSRFGEAQGTGVHVSGQAQGPNAAFSSSSSSVDDQGKIKYSVQSGKY